MASSPEVIDALSNQLVDLVAVLRTDQIFDLLQLLLQLFDSRVPDSWSDSAFQDLLRSVLDVLQVSFDLANGVVP